MYARLSHPKYYLYLMAFSVYIGKFEYIRMWRDERILNGDQRWAHSSDYEWEKSEFSEQSALMNFRMEENK